MQARDVVVAGASAGGVEALRAFAAGLPEDFPAAVLVVLHQPAGGTSALAGILDRAGPLPAVLARDGMALQPGYFQLARPDHHLLVVDEHLRLSHGPTENGHRPSVDALFRSAARALGPRVIGIVFSGMLDDGTAGMVSIASQRGVTVVQDPDDAIYPGMPRSVLRRLRPDHVLAAAQMGPVLAERLGELVDPADVPSLTTLELLEAEFVERAGGLTRIEVADMGTPSELACPDCQGTLVELPDGGKRYRCLVGHAWTPSVLFEAQSATLERALWKALRMLEERVSLALRLQERARTSGNERVEQVYSAAAEETTAAAKALREFLLSGLPPGAQAPGTEGPP